MEHIASIRDLIALWPNRKVLADDITESGYPVTVDRVHKWAQSESIPARFHGPLLRAAAKRGFSVRADDLVRLHDRPEAAA